jgi:probable rRNA maturation factor
VAGDATVATGPGQRSWSRLAEAVLVDEGVRGELDLTFVDEPEMADLNLTHMGHEGPTDVLAFPIDGEHDRAATPDGVPRLLGDVVICPTVARRNAPGDAGVDAEAALHDELALLVVHGVLHILGWDHATDDERRAMQARERHHLDRWRSAGSPPLVGS